MYKEIYEAKPFYGVNPAFVIFCVITVLIALLVIVFWKKVDTGVRCLALAIIVFLFFIISCQAYTSIDAKRKVYHAYVAGEYLTVQGVISDYTLAEEGQPNLPDSFFVDGVEFSVPGFVSAWGYPLNRVNGGILEDGMCVRICYIPYKFENVIMKIEQLE
ncbi:MAG: hypothetical protein J6A50_07155 [Clostridia bacterium]|jgi:hypothetical protein|nr:hypothetical protein [Clostridia bacterium]